MPWKWITCTFFTSAMARVMFSSLSVALSVCLSVCLLAALRKKRLNGFSWNFQGRWDLIQERIFMKCSEKDGRDTGSNLEHFRDVTVNPLNPGSIYYFLDPCLFVIQWKTGERIFMNFLWNVRHDTRNNWLDCFIPAHLGAPGVFVSNITIQSMSGFSWNFQYMLAMTQGTIWNILGIIGITPWAQGSFFYFLGPCLLATSRNTGWMDLYEICRIWTQEAIGCIVSRLSRLFHALQTRRGGGLCSRSASCLRYAILPRTRPERTLLFYSTQQENNGCPRDISAVLTNANSCTSSKIGVIRYIITKYARCFWVGCNYSSTP